MKRSLSHIRLDGFTLIELLVVIAIVGLLVTLAPPLYSNVVPGVKLKTSILDFALTLRQARSQAISSSAPTRLTISKETSSFTLGDSSAIQLDKDISIVTYDYLATPVDTTLSQQAQEDETVIHFFPDGSSSGATVAFSEGEFAYRVDVSWLTGAITMTTQDNGQ